METNTTDIRTCIRTCMGNYTRVSSTAKVVTIALLLVYANKTFAVVTAYKCRQSVNVSRAYI